LIFSLPIICHLGLCKAFTQILLVKIHNSPTFIINLVNNTFREVIGKKNLMIPNGINKHDKIAVLNTKIVKDVIPIKFSYKNFTCSSQTL
jgi:hypothetical protein